MVSILFEPTTRWTCTKISGRPVPRRGGPMTARDMTLEVPNGSSESAYNCHTAVFFHGIRFSFPAHLLEKLAWVR